MRLSEPLEYESERTRTFACLLDSDQLVQIFHTRHFTTRQYIGNSFCVRNLVWFQISAGDFQVFHGKENRAAREATYRAYTSKPSVMGQDAQNGCNIQSAKCIGSNCLVRLVQLSILQDNRSSSNEYSRVLRCGYSFLRIQQLLDGISSSLCPQQTDVSHPSHSWRVRPTVLQSLRNRSAHHTINFGDDQISVRQDLHLQLAAETRGSHVRSLLSSLWSFCWSSWQVPTLTLR